MKRCKQCGTQKEATEFYLNSESADGLQYRCKTCLDGKRSNRRKDFRQRIREMKEKTPCKDCGNVFPHYVTDYDHTDSSTKVGSVSRILRTKGFQATIDEISKCDLVCANCHRERTHQRGTLGIMTSSGATG